MKGLIILRKEIALNTYEDKKIVIGEAELQEHIDSTGGGTIEDFLDSYTYDDAEELFYQRKGYKVHGLYVNVEDDTAGEPLGPEAVYVALEEPTGEMTAYSPMGQHHNMSGEYFENSRLIDRETYDKAAGPHGTPEIYL